MTSPEQYLERLSEIMSDALWETNPDFDGCVDTREEAIALIQHMRHCREDIQSLKREVSGTISAIKSRHATTSAFVGVDMTSLLTNLVFGRRVAGKINTIHRDFIRRSKVTHVSPYEEIKIIADEFCVELDQRRDSLRASDLFRTDTELQAMDVETEPSDRLYAYISDQVKGPYTFDQLSVLYDAGAILDETQCCYEGTDDWWPYTAFFESSSEDTLA
jgi:hypothetical protein